MARVLRVAKLVERFDCLGDVAFVECARLQLSGDGEDATRGELPFRGEPVGAGAALPKDGPQDLGDGLAAREFFILVALVRWATS